MKTFVNFLRTQPKSDLKKVLKIFFPYSSCDGSLSKDSLSLLINDYLLNVYDLNDRQTYKQYQKDIVLSLVDI